MLDTEGQMVFEIIEVSAFKVNGRIANHFDRVSSGKPRIRERHVVAVTFSPVNWPRRYAAGPGRIHAQSHPENRYDLLFFSAPPATPD